MMLADFGADVIRIERREGGEDRAVSPVVAGGDGSLFLNVNRNKRGMTLDLGHPRAAAIVERLVRSADVVVANLPLEVLIKVGLDYEALRRVKPDIILVMASTFGPDGPYRDRVGFDGVAQAMSGAMDLSGFPDAPVRSAVSWVDYGTALHAAFGAMAALHASRADRRRAIRRRVVAVDQRDVHDAAVDGASSDRHPAAATGEHELFHGAERCLSYPRWLGAGADDRRRDVSPLGADGGARRL